MKLTAKLLSSPAPAVGELRQIYAAPKTWTEEAYPKLIYYNRLPKGRHFAAWEEPELFSEEIRAAFRSLR